MGRDGERAAGRLARGCRCFAIETEGRIAAYGWLSTGPEWIGELSLEIVPGPGEGYVWNCFTLQPNRRRGHYRALLQAITRQASVSGLRRLWIGSVEDPAEKADSDAGYRPVLHFTITRWGPVRSLRAEPAPGAPAELVDDARRRLGLASTRSFGLVRARVH